MEPAVESKPLVAVILGGTSPERDISLATGESVLEHFPRDRYEPRRVEIRADGSWEVEGRDPAGPAAAGEWLRGIDLVFPALHGRGGEDGVLQGFLETLGVPYVGSGVSASAIAMDKARTREVLSAQGFLLPAALELRGRDAIPQVDLPIVVKDPTGGSSLDLAVVKDREALLAVVERLLDRPGGRVLIEEYVAGVELTCAVIGNASVGGDLRAFPPVLIRPKSAEWFDYETKYDPDAVDEICPAPVADEVSERVTTLALTAHRTLGCDGITRTDFIVPDDGEPRFLEINTLPGLTAASISPKAAAAAGIGFTELIAMLLDGAREKAGQSARP
ncbi:MAG: D-alanine--D-alanine ligase [Planctomycetota bacterium]